MGRFFLFFTLKTFLYLAGLGCYDVVKMKGGEKMAATEIPSGRNLVLDFTYGTDENGKDIVRSQTFRVLSDASTQGLYDAAMAIASLSSGNLRYIRTTLLNHIINA